MYSTSQFSSQNNRLHQGGASVAGALLGGGAIRALLIDDGQQKLAQLLVGAVQVVVHDCRVEVAGRLSVLHFSGRRGQASLQRLLSLSLTAPET